MRHRLLFLILLVITAGCFPDKEEDDPTPTPPQVPFQPELPKLERPEVILNELARAEFPNGVISAIHLRIPESAPRRWVFEADGNRYKSVTLINPYFICEETRYTYTYHPSGLIDEIVSLREYCQEYTVRWGYKYNYEQGLLVSITGKSFYNRSTAKDETYYVVDNYFSYYPNGKVKDIYSNFRSAFQTWEYGFQRKTLTYDERGNVTQVLRREWPNPEYDERYTFEYDGNLNPLKGLYVVSSVQSELPGVGYPTSLGPKFLSNNCVVSIRTEMVNHPKPPSMEYFDHVTSGGRIIDFGEKESTARGYRFQILYD